MKMFKYISSSILLSFLLLLTACEDGNDFGDGYIATTDDEPTAVNPVSEESTGTENGHAWVDLGLSVCWATTNVGASSPEDYGNYFAWGETTTKTTYNWSTYKYCNGDFDTMTKYCTESSYGTVDSKTTLETSDDAATANWGDNWRMPTDDELTELSTKCTWTWTTQNGVNGYKVTGPNGNSIFLPAAGYRDDTSLSNAGSNGYYWSLSLYTPYPSYARYLNFYGSYHSMSYDHRYDGRSIRPVTNSSGKESYIRVSQTSVSFDATAQTKTVTFSANTKFDISISGAGTTTRASNSWLTVEQTSSTALSFTVTENTSTTERSARVVLTGTDATATIIVMQKGAAIYPRVHAWVDLGLSVCWATTNVGASSPEDYGDYFAWGETTTKTIYSWNTYKYCNGSSNTMTKYCTSSNYGTVDNQTTLEASDDAATANWGDKWRLPSNDELDELSTKCIWTWTTQNSVNGYKVTGPNGNSIFLPAAGCRYDTSFSSTGLSGYYWSSSLNTSYPYNARRFGFSSIDHGMSNYYRYYGQSVRPVTDP